MFESIKRSIIIDVWFLKDAVLLALSLGKQRQNYHHEAFRYCPYGTYMVGETREVSISSHGTVISVKRNGPFCFRLFHL